MAHHKDGRNAVSVVTSRFPASDFPPLRQWQEVALADWIEIGFRGIVEIATGGGKTIFALAAAASWLRQNPAGKVVVIVPTTALQDQWVVAISDRLRVPSDELATWPGREAATAQFHVMIVNTARSASHRVGSGGSVLLIADECHRYASAANSSALDIDADASLGLTATADREYDDGLDEVLVPLLGPVFFRYGLAQARRDDVVSPFDLINVEVALTADERARYDALSKRLRYASNEEDSAEKAKRIALQRAVIVKSARMRLPAAVALMDPNRGRRALVFHEDIASATSLGLMLARRGHSVGLYHSRLGPALRRDNLRQFRDGLLDVLVACRALDEGVDVPEAEMAVIAAASASRRQRIQRLGRVLRRSGGKALATVYTLYATEIEQMRLVDEQQQMTDVASVTWLKAGVRPDA